MTVSWKQKNQRVLTGIIQAGLIYAGLLLLLQGLVGYDKGAKPFRIDWSEILKTFKTTIGQLAAGIIGSISRRMSLAAPICYILIQPASSVATAL